METTTCSRGNTRGLVGGTIARTETIARDVNAWFYKWLCTTRIGFTGFAALNHVQTHQLYKRACVFVYAKFTFASARSCALHIHPNYTLGAAKAAGTASTTSMRLSAVAVVAAGYCSWELQLCFCTTVTAAGFGFIVPLLRIADLLVHIACTRERPHRAQIIAIGRIKHPPCMHKLTAQCIAGG